MDVVIVGGGVIGVTSAWFLRQAGHDVTVIDRQPGAALETSFANAGQVSWTFAKPWAAPGVPLNAVKWMLQEHAPLVLRPRLDPAMWSWLVRMLANCRESRYLANLERMLRIARYSHETLVELRNRTGIVYDHQTRGTLQLFRDEQALATAERERPVLERLRVAHRVLDANGCLEVEPGLRHSAVKIAGGIHYPEDETGDCRAYTLALAERAAAEGSRSARSPPCARSRRKATACAPCTPTGAKCGARSTCSPRAAIRRASRARSASVCRSTR